VGYCYGVLMVEYASLYENVGYTMVVSAFLCPTRAELPALNQEDESFSYQAAVNVARGTLEVLNEFGLVYCSAD
jgi:hypothetical protein